MILDVFCYKSGLQTPPTREFTKSVATWVIFQKDLLNRAIFISHINFRIRRYQTILERIYRLISSLKGGTMVPTAVVLSPDSYAEVVAELFETSESEGDEAQGLEHQLGLPPISVRSDDTDIVVVKELVPNPCPICHHPLKFLRELIERFEKEETNLIRCPLGHRYSGMMKVYHLNIFQQSENSETVKKVTECPACGGKKIQYLGPAEMFCLDCDWDSGMVARYKM